MKVISSAERKQEWDDKVNKFKKIKKRLIRNVISTLLLPIIGLFIIAVFTEVGVVQLLKSPDIDYAYQYLDDTYNIAYCYPVNTWITMRNICIAWCWFGHWYSIEQYIFGAILFVVISIVIEIILYKRILHKI